MVEDNVTPAMKTFSEMQDRMLGSIGYSDEIVNLDDIIRCVELEIRKVRSELSILVQIRDIANGRKLALNLQDDSCKNIEDMRPKPNDGYMEGVTYVWNHGSFRGSTQ